MPPFEETWKPPPVCNVHFTPMPIRPPFQGAHAVRTCGCGRSFIPGKDYGYGYLNADGTFQPEPDQKQCEECGQAMYVYARDEGGISLYHCPGESAHRPK